MAAIWLEWTNCISDGAMAMVRHQAPDHAGEYVYVYIDGEMECVLYSPAAQHVAGNVENRDSPSAVQAHFCRSTPAASQTLTDRCQ